MNRHQNVPQEATWNNEDNQWESGEKNEHEKKTGPWKYWHVEGHLCCTIDFGDGNPPFLVKRIHPNGTIAAEGNWYDGDTTKGKYVGDYFEWDMNGTPMVKRVYDSGTGAVIEEHKYERGVLWMSKVYNNDELTQSFYYRESDPPVVKSCTLYRNDQQDRMQTFFDADGRQLYSVRSEEVSTLHKRRYYNEVLVYEGIISPDDSKAPGFTYFYRNGVTLINYTSHGDGTGMWRMYAEDGQELLTLSETDEADLKEYNDGDKFLPSWSSYKNDTTGHDWHAVIEIFKSEHKEVIVNEKLNALEVPVYLQKELDKVDWKNIGAAMYKGAKLPIAINGMLADDEDVAKAAEREIWHEIEHQGSIYESTYAVATILANMLPYYTNASLIQQRLFNFLYEVLSQPYITRNKELYQPLIAALNRSQQYILQMAEGDDEEKALKAQFLLVHAGQKTPEAEALFIQEWHRSSNSSLRRAYAVFSLGELYMAVKDTAKLMSFFSEAFSTEEDNLVKFILAIKLVTVSRSEAEEKWVTELLAVLADTKAIDNQFYQLQPYFANYGAQEYILMLLGYAKPVSLEKSIEPVIEKLPDMGLLELITVLRTLFSVLFSDELALEEITPVRSKALLAAAEVVDKHLNFLNHKEVFDDFNIPYDSYKLRQLAGKG